MDHIELEWMKSQILMSDLYIDIHHYSHLVKGMSQSLITHLLEREIPERNPHEGRMGRIHPSPHVFLMWH